MTVKQAGYAVFLLVCAICSFFAVIGVSFADDGIGMVITLEGRAVARRNGSDAALALKDRVFKGDTVTAFAGAKIQILLDDDSAITISQNSTVQISDFLDSGSVSKFSAHLAEGRARIVTGRITENNPEGFKVTTKHAAIGIRGTILTV
ncbi:MAG: FecR family protein, partial [Synergistaceae bacterium]|nr:FecR family protein [Synergistaceae bacterium]